MTEVSVVMPTFDRCGLLRDAVASVAAQHGVDWELIIVDDGSSDGTPELLAALAAGDHRIRPLRIAHSGLPAVARNAGIAAAVAPHIAFLDSDDRWHPGKLAHQLALLQADPGLALACCDAQRDDGGGALVGEARPLAGRLLPELLLRNFVICSSVLARTAAIREAGGFDPAPGMRAYEDYHLWLRIAASRPLAYEPACRLTYACASPDSVRELHSRPRRMRTLDRILRQAGRGADPAARRAAFRARTANACGALARPRSATGLLAGAAIAGRLALDEPALAWAGLRRRLP